MTPEERKAMLERARERAQDQILQEREDAQEHQADDVGYVIRTFTNWRGWYCKKNQPRNYIRLMCRKPNHEHWKNVRTTWNCRLQVFKGDNFECDIRITADAYDYLNTIIDEYRGKLHRSYVAGQLFQFDGWQDKVVQDELYEYRIYQNPAAK